MKIEFEGKEFEAYDLILTKENALEILSGKKKIDIRVMSDTYINKFLDKKVRAEQEKASERGEEVFIEDAIKPIWLARFRNYKKTWWMDVVLSEVGLCMMEEEEIKELAEDFDFHDYDNEWQQYADLPDEEKPMFFILAIDKILDCHGLD